MLQRITAITVIAEALATCETGSGVVVDGFAESLEAPEKLGDIGS